MMLLIITASALPLTAMPQADIAAFSMWIEEDVASCSSHVSIRISSLLLPFVLTKISKFNQPTLPSFGDTFNIWFKMVLHTLQQYLLKLGN